MGFFKNGSPFLPFCGSGAGPGAATGAGSLESRVFDGRLVVAPADPCWISVGVMKDEDLVWCVAVIAGLAARPVLMGGGGDFALES